MNTIYRYNNNEFDRTVVSDKIGQIEEQIEDLESEGYSKENEDRIRKLMYAQMIQGLKLSTGYRIF